MSEFRTALEQLMAGTLGADEARARIASVAAREPHAAGAMLAVIESYRAAGRLPPATAADLQKIVREKAAAPTVVSPPAAATPPPAPAPGQVLKHRFVLESVVAGGDKGGMGLVFKARDRIKEEAQDRNPYVAIKVLNEDFKQHPDSMIALQREARRAQSLAHPNIITVYDFDRDGDTFFMAMELLTGSALDQVIRANREKGGLPVPEALKIIVQLGRALSYAHEKGIVHSDFKPSNAFLTQEGVVKVLDFGIARAIQQPDTEKTRFDAGSLGAMTLPYASPEQFERQAPDPSDDVYALAIVSYELLSGRHPFERPDPDNPKRTIRTDSIAARNANMKPAPSPIAGLTRQQWRTLQQGLAFRRADRLRTAGDFVAGMTARQGSAKTLIAAGVAAVALAITSGLLISSYLHRSHLEALTQRLQSGDAAGIAAALQELQRYPPDERAPVLLNDRVEERLLNYYTGRAHEQFNLDGGQYDYDAAMASLKQAQSLGRAYEDSRQLNEAMDRLESDRKTAIARAADAFESELSQGLLIASQGPQNVRSTLALIRQLDPEHPLLSDRRLPIAYASQVRSNLDAGHLGVATALLKAGLQFAPNDPELTDLEDRIARQQKTAEMTARADQLEQAVRPLADSNATLEDFRGKRTQLDALRGSEPASAVLQSAEARLWQLVDAVVTDGVRQRQVDEAQKTVDEFADLLPPAAIARARMQIGSVTSEAQARTNASAQLRARIEQELASPATDDAWVANLQRDLQSLAALTGADDPAIAEARRRAAQAFLTSSKDMLQSQRFNEAQRDLDLARQFDLPPDSYQDQSSAIAQARSQREADDRARQSAAELVAAKQRVLDQALADHIDVAQSQLAELQRKLPANDPFVTTGAPKAIAEAYLARARRSASQARFDDAFSEAQAAQAAAPGLPPVATQLQRFQAARDLARQLGTLDDFSSLRAPLDRLREAERTDGRHDLQAGFKLVVNDRLARLDAQDPAAAARLRASAEPLFPYLARDTRSKEAAAAAPAAAVPPAVAQSSNVPAAGDTAPSPAAASAVPPPPSRPSAPSGSRTAATSGSTPHAAASPATGANTVPANTVAANTVAATSAAGAAAAGPCSSVSAASPPGTACHDDLGKAGRGPEMRVIPASFGAGAFAIMRDETSIADYDAYCASAGCSRLGGANPALPVSSVTEDDAEKYAAWLSTTTNAKYRIPTESEWKRAAGSSHDGDSNCVGASSARGTELRAVTLGASNEFGLRDVTGNVQEWVKPAAGGLKALGGAIGDPIAICQTAFSRPHSGQPDGRTGFRLVREIR